MDPYERTLETERELTEVVRRLGEERLQIDADFRLVGERMRLVSHIASLSAVQAMGDAAA